MPTGLFPPIFSLKLMWHWLMDTNTILTDGTNISLILGIYHISHRFVSLFHESVKKQTFDKLGPTCSGQGGGRGAEIELSYPLNFNILPPVPNVKWQVETNVYLLTVMLYPPRWQYCHTFQLLPLFTSLLVLDSWMRRRQCCQFHCCHKPKMTWGTYVCAHDPPSGLV